MDELTRSRYLQALGTDTYISRGQLPGAAVTRRLAIVQQSPRTLAQAVPVPAKSADGIAAVPVKIPRLETVPAPAGIRDPRPSRRCGRIPQPAEAR